MEFTLFFPEKTVDYLILSFTVSFVLCTMNTYMWLLKLSMDKSYKLQQRQCNLFLRKNVLTEQRLKSVTFIWILLVEIILVKKEIIDFVGPEAYDNNIWRSLYDLIISKLIMNIKFGMEVNNCLK